MFLSFVVLLFEWFSIRLIFQCLFVSLVVLLYLLVLCPVELSVC